MELVGIQSFCRPVFGDSGNQIVLVFNPPELYTNGTRFYYRQQSRCRQSRNTVFRQKRKDKKTTNQSQKSDTQNNKAFRRIPLFIFYENAIFGNGKTKRANTMANERRGTIRYFERTAKNVIDFLRDPWSVAILLGALTLLSLAIWALFEGDGTFRRLTVFGSGFGRVCREMDDGKLLFAIIGSFLVILSAAFAIGHAIASAENRRRGRKRVSVLSAFLPVVLVAIAGFIYGLLLKGWC